MAETNDQQRSPTSDSQRSDQEDEIIEDQQPVVQLIVPSVPISRPHSPTPNPIEPIINIETNAETNTIGQRSRSPSPTQTNTTEYRVKTQISRFNIISNTQKYCTHHVFSSVDEIDGHLATIKDVWKRFQDEHDQLGIACRTTFL
ncbi:hypothetical protein PV328_012445, partial [Microctonus aethiopoides]